MEQAIAEGVARHLIHLGVHSSLYPGLDSERKQFTIRIVH